MTESSSDCVLVTGGAGFIGCNLVSRLAELGHGVIVLDNLARAGSERNAAWLQSRYGSQISFIRADIRERSATEAAAAKADAVFHLAGQVAVTTSLEDPREDFSVNLEGTLGVLEALRRKDRATPLLFASTNKVYGNLLDLALTRGPNGYFPSDETCRTRGVPETRPLAFCTPYGCSKGAADQYVLDYAHSYGLPTAVMRMSCIYGPHQMGNEDQGWVAHFLIQALRGEPIVIFGDGEQVRDILFVEDAINAYLSAWRRIAQVRGQAFNLGGGPENAVSLNRLLAHVERLIGRRLSIVYQDWRPGDQRFYVSDTSRVREALGLEPPLAWRGGVERLLDWLRSAPDSPANTRTPAEAAE